MKIGIKPIITSKSAKFEYVENAEYMFKDIIPESVEVFIFTNNPISIKIRERSITELKENIDIEDIKIISDNGKNNNYIYLLPGVWNFDSYNNTILDKEFEEIKDYLDKYDL